MKRSAAIVLLLFFSRPAASAPSFVRTQLLMGNVSVSITIKAPASKREAAFAAMDKAFDVARRLELSVSEWRPGSDATRLNRNAGKALVPIGRDLQKILLKAAEISEATEGAFDVTFSSKNKKATYRDVVVIPELGLATLRPGVTIGVSGIAKGYIVDRMSEVLKKAGFKNFLVDAGDLYAAGSWAIGIRDPQHKDGPPLCRLKVKDQAVSTSGLYERGLHIVDPASRQPPRKIASVTVVAKSTSLSDALATGFFVLGNRDLERMKKAAASFPGIEVLAVTTQGGGFYQKAITLYGSSQKPGCRQLHNSRSQAPRRPLPHRDARRGSF